MFEGERIGIEDVNGEELCCGDHVMVIFTNEEGDEIEDYGDISYNDISCSFYVSGILYDVGINEVDNIELDTSRDISIDDECDKFDDIYERLDNLEIWDLDEFHESLSDLENKIEVLEERVEYLEDN